MKLFKFFLICVFTIGLFFCFNTKLEAAAKYPTCQYKVGDCVFQMQLRDADKWEWVERKSSMYSKGDSCGQYKDESGKKHDVYYIRPRLDSGEWDNIIANWIFDDPIERNNYEEFEKEFTNKMAKLHEGNNGEYKKGDACIDLFLGCKLESYKGKSQGNKRVGDVATFYSKLVYATDGGYSCRTKLTNSGIVNKTWWDAATDSNIESGSKNNPQHDTELAEKAEALQGSTNTIKILGTEYNCEKLIDDELNEYIQLAFLLIRAITPILLIVFGMLDFTKVIGQNDYDALQKATRTFVKRLIICVIIFLVPTLVNFLMNITGISDGTCGL